MTEHKILFSGGYSVVEMVDSMSRDDDFVDRLAQETPDRRTTVPLFRQRALPAPAAASKGEIAVFLPPALPIPRPDRVWESLSPVALDAERLAENGLFPNAQQNGVTARFDMLRTRMLQAMAERGWKRIAVTSPTHGCGKSMVAANLAFALARLQSCRTVLLDLELRHPDLARQFGVKVGPLKDMLTGDQPLEAHLRKAGANLALALNGAPVAAAAELLLDPRCRETLAAIAEHLEPDVMVIDLPPALGNDDVISVLPHVDAVLLVADGTRSTAEDIRACERLLEGRAPLMGVVLNRVEDSVNRRYRYGKG